MKECPEEASLNKIRIYGSDPGAIWRRNVPASKGSQAGTGAALVWTEEWWKGRGRESQGIGARDS